MGSFELADARVLVVGLGVSGRAAAEVLASRGARVTTVDDAAPDADHRSDADGLLDGVDLVVASPGWAPHHPLLAAAVAAGVPVWSEVELAWRTRVRRADGTFAPWLAVTGTNGKTTTVGMLDAILGAAGLRSQAVGNVGTPVVAAVQDPATDVLAVELSSFQLHFTHSMAPRAAAVLNIAPDHLDWHGSIEEYAAAKGRIFERVEVACVYSVADPRTRSLVEDAEVGEGARAVGITLGTPGPGELGVIDGLLVDRSFHAALDAPGRHDSAAELGALADLAHLAGPDGRLAPHVASNALAAAALARAHGVSATAVREGLRAYAPGAHRIETVARLGEVAFVDDSKATNAHAAAASLAAFAPGSVVWVAGGLAKGADFDELVASRRDRLRAVVLIGVDASGLTAALARHAADVPVTRIDPGETGEVMDRALDAARRYAQEGDTVLLAPAGASMDQFRSYAHRGEEFARAALALPGARSTRGDGR
ncbi:MAG: UDP-N-acetylmuramoyl-L-alanine--D-glutamate ligase [Actinomycetales bacterium]|nr:UDP-N-acetylmuramoyl-L-alanine--D-glutamate ligase [Actinomycetales bacterium]